MDICLGIPCKIYDIYIFFLWKISDIIQWELMSKLKKKKKSSLILKEFSLKRNEIGLGYVKIKLHQVVFLFVQSMISKNKIRIFFKIAFLCCFKEIYLGGSFEHCAIQCSCMHLMHLESFLLETLFFQESMMYLGSFMADEKKKQNIKKHSISFHQ